MHVSLIGTQWGARVRFRGPTIRCVGFTSNFKPSLPITGRLPKVMSVCLCSCAGPVMLSLFPAALSCVSVCVCLCLDGGACCPPPEDGSYVHLLAPPLVVGADPDF